VFRGLLPPTGKAMTNEAIEGDEWGTYVRLDTFSITRTRDCLQGASPKATESSSSRRWGEPITGRRGTGNLITRTSRYARCETPKRFWGSRHRLLESCLRSKDSRAVRGGADGKVPERATRRRPTLLPVQFGRGRLDSLGNKGLAAYLITSLRRKALLFRLLRRSAEQASLHCRLLAPWGFQRPARWAIGFPDGLWTDNSLKQKGLRLS
jgi:hypothetical protein